VFFVTTLNRTLTTTFTTNYPCTSANCISALAVATAHRIRMYAVQLIKHACGHLRINPTCQCPVQGDHQRLNGTDNAVDIAASGGFNAKTS